MFNMNNSKKCECGQMMTFLKTTNDKTIPVNSETLSDADIFELGRGMKVIFDPKRHVSHFINCPLSKKFRKPTEPVKSFFEKD